MSLPIVSATVTFEGGYLAVQIHTNAFGTAKTRALLNLAEFHPLTAASTDAALFDLLDFCVTYYTLDRSVKRPIDGWARRFVINFPVSKSRLDVWRRSRTLISEWLLALTGDIVEVVPLERDSTAAHHERPAVLPLEEPANKVVLLSDGLDSLCGFDKAMRTADSGVVAASVITKGSRRKRIELIRRSLTGPDGRQARLFCTTTRLFQEHKIKEKSQRSRTVLALVTGLTIARTLDATVVECNENGVGLLNLPIPDLQYGAMSSQVLQPAHLPLWDLIATTFLESDIRIVYPNQFRTKAQMVESLSPVARDLIAVTFSCDAEYRKKGAGVLHCGTCGSCRIRQLAVDLGGPGLADAPYANVMMSSGSDAFSRLSYHASLLERALDASDPWFSLVRLQPELRDVPNCESQRLIRLGSAAVLQHQNAIKRDTVRLLRRHVDEFGAWNGGRHVA